MKIGSFSIPIPWWVWILVILWLDSMLGLIFFRKGKGAPAAAIDGTPHELKTPGHNLAGAVDAAGNWKDFN